MRRIRAFVKTDFARHGIAVSVVENRADGYAAMLVPGDETSFDTWKKLDPAVIVDGASYRFGEDVALALLDGLLEHFRGGHDARELRKDYDAERARVDKLIEALIDA